MHFLEGVVTGFISAVDNDEVVGTTKLTVYFPDSYSSQYEPSFDYIIGRKDSINKLCMKCALRINPKPYQNMRSAMGKLGSIDQNIAKAIKGTTAYVPEKILGQSLKLDLEYIEKMSVSMKRTILTCLTQTFTVILVILHLVIFKCIRVIAELSESH